MPIDVLVVSDVGESGRRLADEILGPAGYSARLDDGHAPPGEVMVVDVSRLRSAPLAGLRARREKGDTAPAILLAARLTEEMAADLFRLGVREFLVKPVDAGALLEAVEALHASGRLASAAQAQADQTAAAHESLRRRLEEMRTVAAIGQAVVKTLNLDTLLGRIVDAGVYLTGAEEGALYLVDSESKELVLRASKDPGQVYAGGQRLRVTDTIAGEVFRTGRPVIRKKVGAASELKVKTGYLVNALVNVPLRSKHGVMGVLGVYNRSTQNGFEERHGELLQFMADWASIAIENARLVERLEQSLEASDQTLREMQRQSSIPVTSATITVAPPGVRDGLLQIMGEADGMLAAWKDPLTPGQAEAVTRLRNQAGEMLQQLDLSENLQAPPGAGTLASPDRQSIDLPFTIAEAVKAIRPKAEDKGLTLQADLSGAFPPVTANPARVRQVVEALLTNSVRLTEGGSVILTIYQTHVKGGVAETPFPLAPGTSLADGQWVVVSISDTGPGLPPAELASLKNARATEIPAHTGPGISLGVARLIVEAQGGRLWVDRLPNRDRGSVVTVAFPVSS